MNTALNGGATKVAFLFFTSNHNWLGGKNYYRSLFKAIDLNKISTINIYAVVGKKADSSDIDFPECVTCLQSSLLDRWSFSWVIDTFLQRLLGRRYLLPRLLDRYSIDLVSHCDPADAGNLASIAWIPDFQHIHLPHYFKKEEIAKRNKGFSEQMKRARLVIVSSETARNDLKMFFPEYADKSRVMRFFPYLESISEGNGISEIMAHYGVAEKYFFIPNQFWAHKNHRVAIEAIRKIKEILPDIQIVCSGATIDYRNPDHYSNILEIIDKYRLKDNVKILGVIPHHHISLLMRQAVAVINPSYFEGWSTTVEEAKTLGVKLILSDIQVHREQCQDYEATYFDPNDSNALADCIQHALIDHCSRDSDFYESAVRDERNRLKSLEFAHTYQSIINDAKQILSL